MIERILSVVFPIYGIVAVGYFYGRAKRPDMRFANVLNMAIFVPALVFAALASKAFDIRNHLDLLIGATLVVLGSGLLAWPVARLLKVDIKTFVPPMMFTNSGNMGLPLAVLAFGESALPAAVVLFFAENTLHYSLGTWMLDRHARLTTLWREPVIFAALAGLAVSLLHIPLWEPAWITVKMLGDVSIPLLLFSLGVRLTEIELGDWRISFVGAIVAPLSGLLMAFAAIALLGLQGRDAAMLLIFGTLPPAVLNYVFAEKYQQEPARVASLVMVGNTFSLLTIPLCLAWVL
jgi:malate permease and related proteins